VTQPTFVPVSDACAVRASAATATPEIGRKKKAGLLGAPSVRGGSGHGSAGPDAGYALTLAERACEGLHLPGEDHHDVVVGVAAIAAKRAAAVGRAPTSSDVEVAMDLFALRSDASAAVLADRRRRFAGVAHSYVAQRQLADAVPAEALSQRPGSVTPLAQFDAS